MNRFAIFAHHILLCTSLEKLLIYKYLYTYIYIIYIYHMHANIYLWTYNMSISVSCGGEIVLSLLMSYIYN